MTYHIHFKNFKCPKCGVLFIPFRKNSKCPNCDTSTSEFFDFIPEMIASMKQHKKRYGRYTPDAWHIGSLVEHIQRIMFDIFDRLELAKPDNPKEFIIDTLNKADWQDENYLKEHIKDIALILYDAYVAERISEIKKSPEESRIRKVLRIFMP